jgi:hypothetical protein
MAGRFGSSYLGHHGSVVAGTRRASTQPRGAYPGSFCMAHGCQHALGCSPLPSAYPRVCVCHQVFATLLSGCRLGMAPVHDLLQVERWSCGVECMARYLTWCAVAASVQQCGWSPCLCTACPAHVLCGQSNMCVLCSRVLMHASVRPLQALVAADCGRPTDNLAQRWRRVWGRRAHLPPGMCRLYSCPCDVRCTTGSVHCTIALEALCSVWLLCCCCLSMLAAFSHLPS